MAQLVWPITVLKKQMRTAAILKFDAPQLQNNASSLDRQKLTPSARLLSDEHALVPFFAGPLAGEKCERFRSSLNTGPQDARIQQGNGGTNYGTMYESVAKARNFMEPDNLF